MPLLDTPLGQASVLFERTGALELPQQASPPQIWVDNTFSSPRITQPLSVSLAVHPQG